MMQGGPLHEVCGSSGSSILFCGSGIGAAGTESRDGTSPNFFSYSVLHSIIQYYITLSKNKNAHEK